MAIKGLGTLLKCDFGSGFETISQRVTITGPSLKVRTKETTHLDSTKAEHIATIAEAGEVSCEIEFDPSSSSCISLFGLWNDPDTNGVDWQLIFTDSGPTTYEFTGILTSLEISGMGVDDYVKASVKILVNGDITVST